MSTVEANSDDKNRLDDLPTSESNCIDFQKTGFKETTKVVEIISSSSDASDDAKQSSEKAGSSSPKSDGEIECLEVIGPCAYFGAALMEDNITRKDDITELPIETSLKSVETDKRIPVIQRKNYEPGKPQDNINAKKNPVTGVEVINTFSSLSSLALEYASSDSEEEERAPSPCETITIVDDRVNNVLTTQYRSKPVNDISESEDTDSESEVSSSDESSSSSESDSVNELEESTEISNQARPSKAKKTKSEFDDLPPIEELKITVPEGLCDRLGEISGIVEQLVIVRPIAGKPTLNLDSILFLEKGRRVLGQVFDVFGQVSEPNYCVRFNSEEHIKQSEIVVGMEVYYSPNTEHTSLVFLHELVKLKGVDISGDDDIEPPEFSDDEEERAYNQLQRQKQRQKPGGGNPNQDNSDVERVPQKRQCNDWTRNPWSSNNWRSQSYNNPRPRWNAENSHPPFQNSFNSQNPANPSNQSFVDQYGQPITPQYQFNPYGNSYQQNNLFPPSNPGYAFGRPPGFRPNFNNYEPNLYRPNRYPQPSMSWTPPPPPPPPPSM